MIALYEDWLREYPIISIEDGVAGSDWEGWKPLTRELGHRVQLVGDDVFVTNPEILRRGITDGVGNALLVKLNQIGTVTRNAGRGADGAGMPATPRSSRTVPEKRRTSTIADLAVAHGRRPDQDRIGKPHAIASPNTISLLRIEEELGGTAPFAGRTAIKGTQARRQHAQARSAAPRRKHVESGKPIHRVDRRRSRDRGRAGSARSRAPAC